MILHNGTLIEEGAPDLNLLNRAFKYGDGLFESTRVLNGRPILWKEHVQRLRAGMSALGLEAEDDFEEKLSQDCLQLIEENGITEYGRLRLTVYRGGTGAYLPTDNHVNYLIEAYALKDNPGNNAAISLCDYTDWSLAANPLTGLKTLNALPYVLAARHARSQGFDDAVMYSGGKVSETSSANIFIVKNKRLLTPPLSACCLDGVMRKQIFAMCSELKVGIKESNLSRKDLLQADEMFVTNSVRGMIPVSNYLDRNYQPSYGPMSSLVQKSLERFLLSEFS